MPVGWAAAGAALGAVGSAVIGGNAAENAAETQGHAASDASAVQQHMFDVSNEQQQPFIRSGYGANAELSRLLGVGGGGSGEGVGAGPQRTEWNSANGKLFGDKYLPPDTTTKDVGGGWYEVWNGGSRIGSLRPGGPNGKFVADGSPIPQAAYDRLNGVSGGAGGAGDGTGGTGLRTGYLSETFGPDQFKENLDPGYQFRLQQGAQGVMNGAASGSGSLSGPALKALMDYNQASASGEFNNSFNRFQTQQGNIFQRLTSLATLGQNAAANTGAQGVATGANIGANIVGAGNAAAAGQVGQANAVSGALSDLGSIGGWYAMNRDKKGP